MVGWVVVWVYVLVDGVLCVVVVGDLDYDVVVC